MYSNPPRWAHGDQTVSAARMNLYSDDIVYLNDALSGYQFPVRPLGQDSTGATASFIHTWRWLWYATETGTRGEITGGTSPVILPDTEGVMTAYDLSRISWLSQGQLYFVDGCTYAVEDRNA